MLFKKDGDLLKPWSPNELFCAFVWREVFSQGFVLWLYLTKWLVLAEFVLSLPLSAIRVVLGYLLRWIYAISISLSGIACSIGHPFSYCPSAITCFCLKSWTTWRHSQFSMIFSFCLTLMSLRLESLHQFLVTILRMETAIGWL